MKKTNSLQILVFHDILYFLSPLLVRAAGIFRKYARGTLTGTPCLAIIYRTLYHESVPVESLWRFVRCTAPGITGYGKNHPSGRVLKNDVFLLKYIKQIGLQ